MNTKSNTTLNGYRNERPIRKQVPTEGIDDREALKTSILPECLREVYHGKDDP